MKNNVNINNITKSDELVEFEQKLKRSYDKAKDLYSDLEFMKNQYRGNIDVSCMLTHYHSRRTMTILPIFKKMTLTLEKKKLILNENTETGAASSIQNVQDMYTRNINHEKEQAEKFIDTLNQIPKATNDFIRNYNDMKDANTIGADKYFHAKANSDAAKRGFLGEFTALTISSIREITDTFKNTLFKGMTLKESLKDSKEDLEANKFGRLQGRKNPTTDSKVLVDKYRPNGLPKKY